MTIGMKISKTGKKRKRKRKRVKRAILVQPKSQSC
jgi:hypothetical protein